MEEVMDFEIGHLDIEESQPTRNHYQPLPSHNSNNTLNSQSIILNELQKETEELQNKLKLNNRRLLLFETENSKLIEEKNKFYFEMQNAIEKANLLHEKVTHLESENTDLRSTHTILSEKNQALKKINETQLIELKRFSKFHIKIQNVIKPYVTQLKNSVIALKEENKRSLSLNETLAAEIQTLKQQHQTDIFQLNLKITSLENDRRQTITNYEEQIHSFSKEIIRTEQLLNDANQEVNRLKKAVEFKNYFENELIKFKRIHQDDQKQISELNESLNKMITTTNSQSEQFLETNAKLHSTELELQNKELLLEATRAQLEKTINHSEALSERLIRLEKLNLNLSQQMQLKN